MTRLVAHAPLALAFVLGLLALATDAGAQGSKSAAVESTDTKISVDTILQRHAAVLRDEERLRAATKTFSFTTHRDWDGDRHQTITIHQKRPNLVRIDVRTDGETPWSIGFDGTIAWEKRGTAPAEQRSPEKTQAMRDHAPWDGMGLANGPLFATEQQQLLDFEKERPDIIKFLGISEVAGVPAYQIEFTYDNGVEHRFLDTQTFQLLKISSSHQENGKTILGARSYGDYRNVDGRMFNHSWEESHDGKVERTSTFESIRFDHPLGDELFAMPK